MRLDQLEAGDRFQIDDRVIRDTGTVLSVGAGSVLVSFDGHSKHVQFGDRDFVASTNRRQTIAPATPVRRIEN